MIRKPQQDLETLPLIDKYRVKKGGYLRLATTVALGTGITYGTIKFYHGISEGIREKNSTENYNVRKVY